VRPSGDGGADVIVFWSVYTKQGFEAGRRRATQLGSILFQMVCFQTKNPNLGKFWRVLQWKMMVYFMDTWSNLRSFVIFYGHLV
jgi:hypothetical protein